jgi:hypothetical protein
VYPEAVLRLWLMLASLAALAGGLDPRPAAGSYPHNAVLPSAAIGAEYHGRAFESETGGFLTQDFLVVEVAIYPSQAPLEFSPSHFRLRLNGKPPELLPVTPGTVALAIRNPDQYEQRPGVVAGGGVGGGQVIFGRPRRAERFPGDPEARIPTRGPGQEQAQMPKALLGAAEAAEKFALARMEAPRAGAAGLVYFYWRGKHAKLKRIELIYDGPAGKATLRLR